MAAARLHWGEGELCDGVQEGEGCRPDRTLERVWCKGPQMRWRKWRSRREDRELHGVGKAAMGQRSWSRDVALSAQRHLIPGVLGYHLAAGQPATAIVRRFWTAIHPGSAGWGSKCALTACGMAAHDALQFGKIKPANRLQSDVRARTPEDCRADCRATLDTHPGGRAGCVPHPASAALGTCGLAACGTAPLGCCALRYSR